MNFPGQAVGNWEWRFTWEQVSPENTQNLAALTEQSGRAQLGAVKTF
jgi:4-alpha-glucanotransferase